MVKMAGKPNADTSHMSNEDISRLDLHGAKRPPGKSPGGVLHQQGGVSLKNSGRYPVALAGVLVLAGVGSYIYHRNVHPDPAGQAHSHSPAVQSGEEGRKPAAQ